MEGSAIVYRVYPVSRITGEGRTEFLGRRGPGRGGGGVDKEGGAGGGGVYSILRMAVVV